MSIDSIPIWVVLLLTVAIVLLSLDVGVRLGRWTLRKGGGRLEESGAMVGATMGLLAFMLAFTFNGAATRYETRRDLVIEETNAIDTTWLRAGFLPEPYRTEARGILREYVNVRVKAVEDPSGLAAALRRSEVLQEQIWAKTQEVGVQQAGSIPIGLFIQSLNEVIDLHLKRVTVGVRHRVAPTIWVTLFLLMSAGMVMIGTQVGLSGTRHVGTETALAVSFSLVLFLIADLDRPQQGLIRVSQESMRELQVKLNGR